MFPFSKIPARWMNRPRSSTPAAAHSAAFPTLGTHFPQIEFYGYDSQLDQHWFGAMDATRHRLPVRRKDVPDPASRSRHPPAAEPVRKMSSASATAPPRFVKIHTTSGAKV